MNWQATGATFDVVGKILIGIAVLFVHNHIMKERKINREVLKEMKRVVKKNGEILMLEHVLSDYLLIRFFQHLHNPITKTLFGFNINRNTIENIRKVGLNISKEKNLAFFDVFKKIEIK